MSENIETTSITNLKGYSLNSGCKLMFIRRNEDNQTTIIPVLMLTGMAASATEDYDRVQKEEANGFIGTLETNFNQRTNNIDIYINKFIHEHETKVLPVVNNSSGDWLIISNEDLESHKYQVVYPRIAINSLGLKTDSSSLSLQILGRGETLQENSVVELQPYKDYSILIRALDNQYVLTLNNNVVMKYLYNFYTLNDNTTQILTSNKGLRLNYLISNADVSIYLDALEIAKENAEPKVSYKVKANYISQDFVNFTYNSIGRLVRINDQDLKFNNVQGYISGFTLDLDNPDQDSLDIKNYKTKFEDLFSTITAQTEIMKKNEHNLNRLATTFTPTGEIASEVLQSSIKKVDLNYAFNNGNLTIDEQNGIWGTSDTGVVAFRGGGIFTATERNADTTWKWNTGITPEGINADLITSGQLDTNLIKIYAGNHLSFQMNGDGIFAYKSWMSDLNNGGSQLLSSENNSEVLLAEDSLDAKQYVVFNDQGLSLIAEKGAKILVDDHYYTVLGDETIANSNNPELANKDSIKRVEISWDGLILHNWQDEIVFRADPDTGDLYLKGRIDASSGNIGAWHLDNNKLWIDEQFDEVTHQERSFVALCGGGSERQPLLNGKGEPYKTGNNQDLTVNAKQYCFWAGNPDPEQANFYIKRDGTIKANSGMIGGWTMANNLFFNSNGIFLAPGGYNQQGIVTFEGSDTEHSEGVETTIHSQSINFKNYIIWAPSLEWSSTNNGKLPANIELSKSVNNPVFAITRTGQLMATEINGCKNAWFKGATLYDIDENTRSLIVIKPNGAMYRWYYNYY